MGYHAGKLAQISLLSHCMCLMYVCFSTYLADWTVEKSEKRTVENKQAGTVYEPDLELVQLCNNSILAGLCLLGNQAHDFIAISL